MSLAARWWRPRVLWPAGWFLALTEALVGGLIGEAAGLALGSGLGWALGGVVAGAPSWVTWPSGG